MLKPSVYCGALLLGATLIGCSGSQDNGPWAVPDQVTVLVPFAAGGGSDISGRAMAKAIEEVRPGLTVTVENRDGGSGAIGYTEVSGKKGRRDLLVSAENTFVTLPTSGNVTWTIDDFEPIAQVAEDRNIVIVRSDAPFNDCRDLINAAKSTQVKAGIGGLYSVDNVFFNAVESEEQAEFIRVNFESGAEQVTSLLAGDVDVLVVNPAEALGQIRAGDFKPLCVVNDEPITDISELDGVHTSVQDGVETVYTQFRGFLAPAGLPEEGKQWWIDTLAEAADAQAITEYIATQGLEKKVLIGDDFRQSVEQNKKIVEGLL